MGFFKGGMQDRVRGLRQQATDWTKQNVIKPSDGVQDLNQSSSNQHSQATTGTDKHIQLDRLHFEAHPTPPPSEQKRQLSESAISCVDMLGDVHSATTHVTRDLGFQGQVGNYVLLTYGDTMYSDGNYSDQFRGMTSDSVALATHDPLVVVDPDLNDNGYPKQFCPIIEHYGEDASECALGITNAVETYPGQAILFFLLNHRPNGVNNLKGAGVATITVSDTNPPKPNISRLAKYWWDGETEPWYGDVGAIRWNNHIYAYGHAKDSPFVYLTRVKWEEATKLECYEYWNGQTWQSERLKTKDLSEKESIFWQVNQGQVIWSNHFQCFLFVYCDNWMNSKVLAKTAPAPEGPWSEPVTLYQATPITEGSSVYAAVPHPYHDHSGKTLVVTFTNHPNTIQAIRVTFK